MKKEVKFTGEHDLSQEIRDLMEDQSITELVVTNEGEAEKFWATGRIDPDDFQARHGIFRIENRDGFTLRGANKNNVPIVYTKEPAVPEKGDDPYTTGRQMSQRKFIMGVNSKNINIYDFGVMSNNDTPDDKPGRPRYEERWEFEHGIHLDDCDNVHIKNFYGKYIWGDGVYIRNTKNTLVEDVTIDWNGRQGGAIISGENVVVRNFNVLNSRRSGFDIEGNLEDEITNNFLMTQCYLNNYFYSVPIGGRGLVQNLLVIDNDMGGDMWCEGNGVDRLREKIILSNNKVSQLGHFRHTNGVLIEHNYQGDYLNNKVDQGTISHCTNVTIRYNDIPNYGRRSRSNEPFFCFDVYSTPLSEISCYGNKQKIGFIMRDITVKVNDREDDKWYWAEFDSYTDFNKLAEGGTYYPTRLIKNGKKLTDQDFWTSKEYGTVEEMVADYSNQANYRPYKVTGGDFYRFVGTKGVESKPEDYIKLTIDDHIKLHPIEFLEDKMPEHHKEDEIPFDASEEIKTLYKQEWDRINGVTEPTEPKDEQPPVFEKIENQVFRVKKGVEGLTLSFNPVATDNSGDPVEIKMVRGEVAGGFYPVGDHEIVYEATDSSGNTSRMNFIVSIQELVDEVVKIPTPETKQEAIDLIEAGLIYLKNN